MKPLIEGMQAYYTKRGIFQGHFGFGKRPAVIAIDLNIDVTLGGARRIATLVRRSNALNTDNRQFVPYKYNSTHLRPFDGFVEWGWLELTRQRRN